jgi:hypothetical protein
VHSLSRTVDGYDERLQWKVDTVKKIRDAEAWTDGGSDEWEEAREVVESIVKAATKKVKGKGRP